MSTSLEIAIEALEKIAAYGHAENCTHSAPVHECVCREEDERDIAREALALMESKQ